MTPSREAERSLGGRYGSRIWAGPTPYAGLPTHVYNQLNRLVEVRDPSTQAVLGQYAYDAFGRRVRKITASGTTLFLTL